MSRWSPLRWVSSQALSATKRAVEEAVSAWASAWGVKADAQVTVLAVARWPATEEGHLDLAVDGEPPAGWREALAMELLAVELVQSAVARDVVEEATQQWQGGLRQALGVTASTVTDMETAVPLGHLGLWVQVELLGSTWVARLPQEALVKKGLLSLPSPAPVASWAPEQALVGLPVPLEAVLARVEVNAWDVLHLTPGDVLTLPVSLPDLAEIEIRSPGSSLRLRAILGTSDARRAVQWLGLN